MKHYILSFPQFMKVVKIPLCLLAALTLVALGNRSTLAADEFQKLINQVPRSANAVVLLNMEEAKNSPLGIKEDWKGRIGDAFAAGAIRVPPQAVRFVIASRIDFEFMEPEWEVAIMELNEDIPLESLAKTRGGTLDTIEGLQAVFLPNDTCVVQLGPKILGGMAPANRQSVVRWIREVRKPTPQPLSPYLQKAAVYSDVTGSEIIMALDLDGVMSFERVGKYLKNHQNELDTWQADLIKTTNVLSDVQGIRIGVRIGEKQSSSVAVDFRIDASSIAPFAKPLLLQILFDKGAMIDDFQSWSVQSKGKEISLSGLLSDDGRRRLLSVIESPVSENVAMTPSVSPGDLSSMNAKKSREYFLAVMGMANGLKKDMRSAKNLASSQLYFDKYAKRIERMPILGVDEAILDYSAFVANALRQASGSVKTMGIQTNVRQTQETGGGVTSGNNGSYAYYGYSGYGGYRYGASGVYGRKSEMSDIKAAGAQKRVVKAEETATMATDVQQLRQEIIAATTEIRRQMTQKYQIEF